MQSQPSNYYLKTLQDVDEGIQQSSIFNVIACFISIALLLISDISVKLKCNVLLKN
jgi:hypothetical protein